jgi:hypothetical protein
MICEASVYDNNAPLYSVLHKQGESVTPESIRDSGGGAYRKGDSHCEFASLDGDEKITAVIR